MSHPGPVWHTRTLDHLAVLAADAALPADELRNPSPVIHSCAALLALLVTTTLSVYKPRGMTRYGRRKQREIRQALRE